MMDFSENQHNAISQSRQLLYSVVSKYSSGISDLELKKECTQVQGLDVRGSNVSTALYDMKGSLIDFSTMNGFRVFRILRKQSEQVHPWIEVGPDSKIHTALPLSFIDANSFCVYLVGEENNCLQYTQKIHEYCKQNWSELYMPPSFLVNVGDCFVVYSTRHVFYLRVKVVKVFRQTSTVMCFLLDLGRYETYAISDLRVASELCLYYHQTLKIPQTFKEHAYAVRCYIDASKKPYGGFPQSRTGMKIALCGHEETRNVRLKLRFLAYDELAEAFMVDVFTDDGRTSKLEQAVIEDSAILEKDKFYAIRLDGDFEGFDAEDDNAAMNNLIYECNRYFSIPEYC